MNQFFGISPTRRLPIFRTAARACELLWLHRWLQLRLMLPAFLLLAAAVTLLSHKMAGVAPDKVAEAVQSVPASYWIANMFACMGGMILLLMFSATWRRFLLLDEPPASITFAKPFRRYLVMFIVAYFSVVFGALLLSNVAVGLLGAAGSGNPVIGALLILATLIGCGLLLARYALIFTAAIVGNADMRLRQAATLMRGNTLRFAAAWTMIMVGVNIVDNIVMSVILSLFHIELTSLAAAILAGVLTAGAMIVMVSLTASIAALTYDFLVHGGGPGEAGR